MELDYIFGTDVSLWLVIEVIAELLREFLKIQAFTPPAGPTLSYERSIQQAAKSGTVVSSRTLTEEKLDCTHLVIH